MTMLAAAGFENLWQVLVVAVLVFAVLLSFWLRYLSWAFMTGRRKRKQLDSSAIDESRPPR